MAVLTEEQTMLKDGAKDWVQTQAPVAALRKLRDSKSGHGFDPALWAQMGQMGWAGVLVDEAHGGSGFGYLGMGVILEETGRTLAASPLLSTALIGACALQLGGSAAQQAEWLPKIAAGACVVALAVDEGPHHDPLKTALSAQKSADGYVLTGAKTFVLDGMEADLLIVAARTGGRKGEADGITLFLVPGDAGGLTRRRMALVDSRGAADLAFEGVQVPADAVLGREGAGMEVLEPVLDRARAGLAAEMLGTAAQAFETTLDYLKTRTQFGVLIGSFQALQHRAAQMFTSIELTRSVVEAALQDLDKGSNDVRAACSIAKAMAGETLHKVSQEMVQMHGGIGMTDQADMGLYLKRARVTEAAYGSASYHRDRYARLNGF